MKSFIIFLYTIFALSITIPAQYIENDSSFNPDDAGFGKGDLFFQYGTVTDVVIQPDSKIIAVGSFSKYNGIGKNSIVRINADGSLDESFNIGTGFNGSTKSIALQPDNKIIVTGSFTAYNGYAVKTIARLNSDGTIDQTFNPGTGFNNTVYCVAVQSNGNILVGGNFTAFNGTARNYFACLNPNGSLNTIINIGSGFTSYVNDIEVKSDDKIILVGGFSSYDNTYSPRIIELAADCRPFKTFSALSGPALSVKIQQDGKILVGGDFTNITNRIIRFNTDGQVDTSFKSGTGFDGKVNSIGLLADGKIIVGGEFKFYNGFSTNRIVKLNPDGTKDSNVPNSGKFSGPVNVIAIQSDGKIISGGSFTSFDLVDRTGIQKLSPDLTADLSFNPPSAFNNNINKILVQPDGKILVAGRFISYKGFPSKSLTRINSDGTRDNTFQPGTGFLGGIYNVWVKSIALQPDGKIVACGNFTEYNGTAINRIARINSDGSLDSSFNVGTGFNTDVETVFIQSDGKILVGGSFSSFNGVSRNRVARLLPNGTLDTTFIPANVFNNTVSSIIQLPSGKIVVGGQFSKNIVGLNEDGTINSGFSVGTGFDGPVLVLEVAEDKILVGGRFFKYNNSGCIRITRLNSDGLKDNTFLTGSGFNNDVYDIDFLIDGKILVGGVFTQFNYVNRNYFIKLNGNGSLDTNFDLGQGFDSYVYSIDHQLDGNIIVAGGFLSYNNVGRNRIARLLDGSSITALINTSPLESAWNIYPNPSSNGFNIKSNISTGIVNVKVTDLSGAIIKEINLDNYSEIFIVKEGLSAGIYIIKIVDEFGRVSVKSVVVSE